MLLSLVILGTETEPRWDTGSSDQEGHPMSMLSTVLDSRIRDLLPELERVYTDIHAHPELAMQETRTARIAADHLRGKGYDVTDGIGGTGVVGLLRNGDGPTVMLRADMDALPVREQTGLPYASTQTATDSYREDRSGHARMRSRYARDMVDGRGHSPGRHARRLERDC